MSRRRADTPSEVGHALSTFARKFREVEERAFERHLPKDITARDVRVLSAVAEAGEDGMSALVKRLHVAQPTVSIAISRLEHKGLVERAGVDGDLRKRRYVLSERGKLLDRARKQASGEAEMVVFSALPKAERAKFETFIQSAIAALL